MNTGSRRRPGASLDVLRLRASMLQIARRFFAERGVLEVTTPALNGATVTDPHIASIACNVAVRPGRRFYLHTSPEYRMKELLAAHRQDIYQICPVYRDNELGALHQAEFTMIEWYRQAMSMAEMIDETAQLIEALATAGEPAPGRSRDAPMRRCSRARRVSIR
jgi:lysyl-tRNA synthetase class 2